MTHDEYHAALFELCGDAPEPRSRLENACFFVLVGEWSEEESADCFGIDDRLVVEAVAQIRECLEGRPM